MPVKRSYSNITPGGSKSRKIVRAKRTNGVSATSKLSGDHRILSQSKVVTMRYQEEFDIDASAWVYRGSMCLLPMVCMILISQALATNHEGSTS